MRVERELPRLAGSCALLVALALLAPGRAESAATFVIANKDAAGVGFNDPTPAAPVGGNPGTTLGQQRMNAFQFAANLWGARLTSSVTINVDGNFGPLTPCNSSGGVIGSAGPTNVFYFPSAVGIVPANTLVSVAEAEKLTATNLNAGVADIAASFNSNIGTAGCLTSLSWYLGFDANPPANTIDFVSVLLHELGHGLGFLSLVNTSTGALNSGLNDMFTLNLHDNGVALDWTAMTNAQRLTSITNTNQVVWTGAATLKAAGSITSGKDGGGHPEVFTPNPLQVGSSVSHWTQNAGLPNPCPACSDLLPKDLMKPAYTGPTHATLITHLAMTDIGWGPVAAGPTGDFNVDGTSDLIWRNYGNGQNAIWYMNGLTPTGAVSFNSASVNWSLAATGDFNGDGHSDLVWRNTVTGENAIWFMIGATPSSAATFNSAPVNWSIVGTGDFNGDGQSDIVWRNTVTGENAIWYMNGSTPVSSAAFGSAPTDWSIVGVGDFNGDGKPDIVWRNTVNGSDAIWFMNNTAIIGGGAFAGAPTNWAIGAVGDFNGDGKADIVWRNTTTGENAVWFMNGLVVTGGGAFNSAPTAWSLAGPR